MKITALSHYDEDIDTRYGDCIMIYDDTTLAIYDCGHNKHAEYIESFLEGNSEIKNIELIISHNDSDHTSGFIVLLEWLNKNHYNNVRVFSHQFSQYANIVYDKLKDGRTNQSSVALHLLNEFDNIQEILDKSDEYGYETIEALENVNGLNFKVVGPSKNFFIETIIQAIDNRRNNVIAEETVMNAASVQISVNYNGGKVLLCGDASPDVIKDIKYYDVIQLPHHGKKESAINIFKEIGGNAYFKKFLISDNTGSSKTSGGSDDLIQYMKEEQYSAENVYNTKNGIVDLPNDNFLLNMKRGYLG